MRLGLARKGEGKIRTIVYVSDGDGVWTGLVGMGGVVGGGCGWL